MTSNFLVRGDETERIEFDDGAWVDIRRCLTVGERQAINKLSMRRKTRSVVDPKTRKTDIQADIEFDDGAWLQSFMEKIIVDWSDETPVRPDTIMQMPEWMATRIREEFERLNPDREDESLGESLAGSAPTTESAPASTPESSDSFGS